MLDLDWSALWLSLSSAADDPNLGLGYWHAGSLAAQVQWQGAAVPLPASLALVLVAGLAALGSLPRRSS